MKPLARSILGAAGGLLVLSAVGTIGFMSAIANQQSSSLQTASGDGGSRLAMTNPPNSELEPDTGAFVLAQMGMGGGGMGMGGMGGGMAGMGGMGGGMFGMPTGADMPKEVVIKWEKPNGTIPSWLDGGTFENEREVKMRAQLNDRIDIEFKSEPLSAAIEYISKTANVPCILDETALVEESITPDEPITLNLKDARIRNILALMLEPLQLTYVIEYEMVRVTSRKISANELRFYDLSYLLPDSGLRLELLAGLEASISPDQWQSQGGNCSMRTVGSMLLITAPQDIHFAVERFLYEVSKQSPANFKPRALVEKPTSKSAEGDKR